MNEFGPWSRIFILGLLLALFVQSPLHAQSANAMLSPAKANTLVPIVGCESDGQTGSLPPPVMNKQVVVSVDTARKLAFYQAEDGPGVLAPRGWYCFGTYGSNGSSLYVSPKPIRSADLFSTTWKGFKEDAVQISVDMGDTSGRSRVAEIIARVFPAYRSFVENVIAEGIEPAGAFPFGPYPKDKLVYTSTRVVEFQTPANTDGLGTHSRLLENSRPVKGAVVLFGQEPNLIQVSLRLPSGMDDLTQDILHQAERDAVSLELSNNK